LDAYARAAELDPTNTHIKSRLQLLRSGGATGPNQHNAPVPQDVHPQAYQNGVGVPPGPQWGGQHSQAQQGPPPQVDPARITDWTRGIAGIQQPPQQQLPQSNPYEQRDGMRAPPPHPSPRQEPPRQYQDPARPTPVRKQSPSPKMNSAMPGMYPPGPQSLPQLNMQDRAPAFGSVRPPPPTSNGSQANGINGAPPQTNLPPYGRPFSPPQELRPLQQEQRPPSPGPSYPHQVYNHQPPTPSGSSAIANGAPPPAAALVAAEAAARERDDRPREDRPQSAMKRSREWEGESGPSKKPANDETRARLEEPQSRRASPPPPQRMPTPREEYRRSASEIRRENERRATENYHPSEAAHHPYTLPAQQMPSVQSIMDPQQEQKQEPIEAAARKVDVDEDYDNNSEDERRAAAAAASTSATGEAPKDSPINGTPMIPKQEGVTA
jgi:glucose repression mediator protein